MSKGNAVRPGRARLAAPGIPLARNCGYVAIGHLSSVSSGVVNGGDDRTAGSRPGIRATINARLEEVSFRTGVVAGAATLLVIAAAAAAVVITVLPSQGSPVNRAAGAPVAASSPAAHTVPATVPSAPASPTPPGHTPTASSSPAAPAARSQPSAQASEYSPDAYPAARDNAAVANSGGRAQVGGMPASRRPIQWGGSPRYGRTGVFTGALWRPAPRVRFGGMAGR